MSRKRISLSERTAAVILTAISIDNTATVCSPRDIEEAACAGALWLQLEPSDGARLVAAVKGLISATGKDRA
jgi:hypothetical protein